MSSRIMPLVPVPHKLGSVLLAVPLGPQRIVFDGDTKDHELAVNREPPVRGRNIPYASHAQSEHRGIVDCSADLGATEGIRPLNTTQSLVRVGTAAAFVGAPLLLVSTLLHPSNSDPNVPLAAFTEYAASSNWVWIHLGQFAGCCGVGSVV
jgi:hypothetical protein